MKKYIPKSESLRHGNFKWSAGATKVDLKFVDTVFRIAEANYERGGDEIVECYTPETIIESRDNAKETYRKIGSKKRVTAKGWARDTVGLRLDAALNVRWGEDSDPELERAESFKGWKS
tara:strand:+ start:4014 stop:4370 length:357 start_codon:yes stop_codon:yes gene_type:complete